MNKTNKIIKVVSASLVALASLIMVILAIVNLVKGSQGGGDETLPFRIILSVMLILASFLSTFLVVSKDPRHFDVKLMAYNGLLLGAGIFAALNKAGEAADTIIGYLIPCLLIGLGAFFVIATIVSISNKINKRGTNVLSMILGVLLLVIGIVLIAFAPKTIPVMWLIIGIILLVYSVFALVAALKKDKKAIEAAPINADAESKEEPQEEKKENN